MQNLINLVQSRKGSISSDLQLQSFKSLPSFGRVVKRENEAPLEKLTLGTGLSIYNGGSSELLKYQFRTYSQNQSISKLNKGIISEESAFRVVENQAANLGVSQEINFEDINKVPNTITNEIETEDRKLQIPLLT